MRFWATEVLAEDKKLYDLPIEYVKHVGETRTEKGEGKG